jgi:hypothetical protein
VGGVPAAADRLVGTLTERPLYRLRRWYRAEPPPRPQPDHQYPPRGKKQPTGIRWDEVKDDKVHRDVHRFVDSDNRGWEAPDATSRPFAQTDWHRAAEKAQAWWYDATASRWKQGEPPATHRKALAEERPALTTDLHGYPSAAAVPVYVKAKYRQKAGTKTKNDRRGPGLRALDRAARVLMQGMPETGTPHLATATDGGKLRVAGNTGARHVTVSQSEQGSVNLAKALDTSERLAPSGRAAKDARKLRALQSGDYRAHHAKDEGQLTELSTALKSPPVWSNVGLSRGSAEHGEMTVLADVHKDLTAHPNTTGTKIVKPLGGVKLACGACALAFQAYNKFIAAPLGYTVKVSGTHGGFYVGWRCPDVIWNDAAALKYVREGLPEDAYLDPGGVLLGVTDSTSGYHDPEDSDSEWEEV